MKWAILAIGVAVATIFNQSGEPLGFWIGVLIVGITGGLFVAAMAREQARDRSPKIDPAMITLRRMAIRLRYLSQEGTLSKTGDTVRFDADGPDSANEFMDTIMAIVETAE